MLKAQKHIHFIGIGGAGMSAMAEVVLKNGFKVTGSDKQKSHVTRRLEILGIEIQYSHTPEMITGCDMAVYSSAVKEDNPERLYAIENRIVLMRRAEMLGELMRAKFSIGVSGTHGKTTTTSLIGHVFSDAKLDPTIIVGGTMRNSDTNAVTGGGKVLVAEADEYDRSFLAMYPAVVIVTNIEADHLDCYKDLDDISDTFVTYINRVPFYGMALLCKDDDGVKKILPKLNCSVVTYGISEDSDYYAGNLSSKLVKTSFDVFHKGNSLGRVEIPLCGIHNVRNAMATIALSCEMSIPFDVITESLEKFGGVKRRFEIIGYYDGVTIVDDYAHHPSEISATISAAKDSGYNRVIAIFQPHLYSRTRDFLNEFADSLVDADVVIVTEIYKAREKDTLGISGENIHDVITDNGFKNSIFIKNKDDIIEKILPITKEGDVVIFMGAGDIGSMAGAMLRRLENA